MERTTISEPAIRTDAIGSAIRTATSGTHLPLALAALLLLVIAGEGVDQTLAGPGIEAMVAGVALALAWRRRSSLRLAPVLALGLGLQLARLGVHVALGVHADADSRMVYTSEGSAVLHGTFPPSPYPAGAVALFTLETWLGGGSASTTNALLMIPFQALVVIALWALKTRWSAWTAAAVALWPLNAFFWDYRFDLVPAATIAVGIVLARRERWHAAGWALGLGAVAKWTPALTAVVLLVWLLSARRVRTAAAHTFGFAIPFAIVSIPPFLFATRAASAPYRAQSMRDITGESLPYLPLRALGLARPARHYYGVAHVPSWSNPLVVLLQILAVAVVVALAARVRPAASVFALAALAPAVFLLTNRVFSPQYFVVIVVVCAVAALLVVQRASTLLAIAGVVGAATVANATLFPALAKSSHGWAWMSAAALLPACVVVVWLAAHAVEAGRTAGR